LQEGDEGFILNRYSGVFSPAYTIVLYIDKTGSVVRATGWKVRPNTLQERRT